MNSEKIKAIVNQFPKGTFLSKSNAPYTVARNQLIQFVDTLALNEITIDQKKCREICFTSTEGGGWLIACNLCRTQCPLSL